MRPIQPLRTYTRCLQSSGKTSNDFVGREARSCLQKLGGGPGNVAAEPGLNCKYKSKLCIGSLVFKLKKMCSVSAFNFLGSDVVVGEEPYILQSC
nr:hypothetical protein CFP56_27680 [Quercus suber]